MLRYTVAFGSRKVVVTHDQLQIILSAFPEPTGETIEARWVGSGKGENGGDYTYKLETKKVSELISGAVEVLPETEYNTRRFFAATESK